MSGPRGSGPGGGLVRGVSTPGGSGPGGVYSRGGSSPAGGVPGGDPPRTATAADVTHPTGMHSCHTVFGKKFAK